MEVTPNIIESLALDIYNKTVEIIQEETGVTLDRLCELAKADSNGRCSILPCNVGDTVYCMEYAPARIYERYVYGYQFNVYKDKREAIFEVRDSSEDCCWWYELEQFGEDIFLTRESAESALKEQEATP